MTEKEKIDLLIASKTKENNFLAVHMMMKQLGYSFKEAFLELQFDDDLPHLLIIDIAEIRIVYHVEFFQAIDVPSDWGEIERKILVNQKEIEGFSRNMYIDEGTVWSMPKDMPIADLKTIQLDLHYIVHKVERLFNKLS